MDPIFVEGPTGEISLRQCVKEIMDVTEKLKIGSQYLKTVAQRDGFRYPDPVKAVRSRGPNIAGPLMHNVGLMDREEGNLTSSERVISKRSGSTLTRRRPRPWIGEE